MTFDQDDWEHSHGYHLTRPEFACRRCAAGELPTQAELMVALIFERVENARPRLPADYRAELQEWLDLDRDLELVAQSEQNRGNAIPRK